jgi:hypothetical protein
MKRAFLVGAMQRQRDSWTLDTSWRIDSNQEGGKSLMEKIDRAYNKKQSFGIERCENGYQTGYFEGGSWDNGDVTLVISEDASLDIVEVVVAEVGVIGDC